jgi:hypothetical protein
MSKTLSVLKTILFAVAITALASAANAAVVSILLQEPGFSSLQFTGNGECFPCHFSGQPTAVYGTFITPSFGGSTNGPPFLSGPANELFSNATVYTNTGGTLTLGRAGAGVGRIRLINPPLGSMPERSISALGLLWLIGARCVETQHGDATNFKAPLSLRGLFVPARFLGIVAPVAWVDDISSD